MEQALPTQYPDLGVLFQNMPAIAAWQTGTQQNLADQNNRSLQDAFSADQAQKALERPYDLQQKQATVRSTNADAGYNEALARGSNIKSDVADATKQSEIDATLAGNKTKLTAEHVKQMEDMGDLYRLAGARAASATTPWEKVAAVKETLGNHIQQSPEFDKFLLQNVNNLHQYFADAGNNVYEATRAAKAERMKEEAAQKRTETQGDAARDVAKINASAKTEVAGIRASGPKAGETLGAYEARIRKEAQAGDPDARAELQKLEADKINRAAAAAGVSDKLKREVLGMPDGSKAEVFIVTNEADYAQVPSGGMYKDPQGKVRKKK